jgi:hypothetical protein
MQLLRFEPGLVVSARLAALPLANPTLNWPADALFSVDRLRWKPIKL